MKKHSLLLVILFAVSLTLLLAKKRKIPMNIVLILSDDRRYDFMRFTNAFPGLKLPGMDRVAIGGIYLKNAFITTFLCSPILASVLTHQHSDFYKMVIEIPYNILNRCVVKKIKL